MIYEEYVKASLEDYGRNGRLEERAILRVLEDISCYHSDSVGYGARNIQDRKLAWLLLEWRVKIHSPMRYGESYRVTTWSRGVCSPCTTLRDFEIFDEEGNCFCSMERCWFQGKGDFRKPISCWLYPIRITQLRNGMRALNLHRWHICKDAFEKGKKEKIRVYQFLREPIERYFGEDFYQALDEAAKMLNSQA